MISALGVTAAHSTAPWYIAVPLLVIVFALRTWQWRRRRGSWRRGRSSRGDRNDPFGGYRS